MSAKSATSSTAFPKAQRAFNPTAACPPTTQPETLTTAYQSYKSNYEAAFALAVAKDTPPPKPTIDGIKEANLVSEWSRKKAKGQRVPIEPPSLNADGTVAVTARMGRIDSPAGKRQAALDAAAEAKKKAAEEKKAIALAAAEKKKQAAQAKAEAAESRSSRPGPCRRRRKPRPRPRQPRSPVCSAARANGSRIFSAAEQPWPSARASTTSRG